MQLSKPLHRTLNILRYKKLYDIKTKNEEEKNLLDCCIE